MKNPLNKLGSLSSDEQLFFKMSFLARSINHLERDINELKAVRATITVCNHIKSEKEQEEWIREFPMMEDIMYQILEDPEYTYMQLMKMDELQRIQEENIRLLKKFIEIFLSYCLPKALWKRELDLPLNWIEQCLLMELIPYTTQQPFWNQCIERVTQQMENIFNKKCRSCGKGIKMHCQKCKESVGWCSIKCKQKKESVFEHQYLECIYFKLKK